MLNQLNDGHLKTGRPAMRWDKVLSDCIYIKHYE